MPRSGPGVADKELIAQLAERELTVSLAQLERWRSAGLLPRNTRHGRGRGRGSVSAPTHAVVEIAAELATHSRQGRDLRLTVVDWFAEAGRVMPGDAAVPVVRLHPRAVGYRQQILDPSAALVIVTVMSLLHVRAEGAAAPAGHAGSHRRVDHGSVPMGQSPVAAARSLLLP